MEKKKAIPFRRYNSGLSHKKEVGPGRFPFNSSREIFELIESAEANAQFKGLNTADLIIKHICVHKGSTQWHYGRQRRRQMKRINLEIVLSEEKQPEKKEKAKKTEKKGDKK